MNIKSTRNVLTTTALAAALVIPTVTPALGQEASAATTQSAKKLKVSAATVVVTTTVDSVKTAIDTLDTPTASYIDDVVAIRAAYNGITGTINAEVTAENTQAKVDAIEKAKVTNLTKLVTAEANVKLINAVIDKIDAIAGANDLTKYKAVVTTAKTALSTLDASLKVAVTNSADLTTAEGHVEKINAFTDALAAVNPALTTFVAKVETANEAYKVLDGITVNNKSLTTAVNASKLTSVAVGATETSKTTYLAQAAAVTKVQELLEDLSPATLGLDYVTKVNEANTAFLKLTSDNNLSSTNAKEQVAFPTKLQVHLDNVKEIAKLENAIDALKFGTGYVAAVEKVDGEYKKAPFVNSTIPANSLNVAVKAKSVTDLEAAVANKEKIKDLETAIGKLVDLTKIDATFLDAVTEANATYTSTDFATLKSSVAASKVTELTTAIANKKKVTDLVDAITAISPNKTSYLTDIAAALKTYEALKTSTPKLAALVSNIDVLTNVVSGAEVAGTHKALSDKVIAFDDKVKALSSAKDTYLADVTAAEAELEKLKEDDLDKFAAASKKALTAHSNDAKTVQSLIDLLTVGETDALSTKNSTYVADVAKALKTYNALSTNLKARVTNSALLTKSGDLTTHEAVAKSITTLITDIKALKTTDAKFFENYTKVATSYNKLLKSASEKTDILETTTDDNKNLAALVTNADVLVDHATAVATVKGEGKAYTLIAALNGESTSDKIKTARTAYDALDKNLQKYVNNYKTLTTQEARVKGANAVLTSLTEISDLTKFNEKTFATNAKKLKATYDKLTSAEKTLVGTDNAALITSIAAQAKVYEKISKIKSSSSKFVDEIYAAKKDFLLLDATTAAEVTAITDTVVKSSETVYSESDKVKYVKNIDVVIKGEEAMAPAVTVINEIAALKDVVVGQKITEINTAKANFNKLDPQIKKYVTNAKDLTSAEKSVKNAVAAKTLIAKIPAAENAPETTDKSFVGLVTKAEKAVKKLSANELALIDTATPSVKNNIESLAKQAAVFTKIAKLKPSAKYIEQVDAAQKAYDDLTPATAANITHLTKAKATLDAAKAAIVDPNAAITAIKALEVTPFTSELLTTATAAFDKLDSNGKKYVTNAKLLTNAKKQLKAAQKIDALILTVKDLDASSKSYAAKKASLTKAYNKLTDQQKALLAQGEAYTSLPEATTVTK